jgi:MATE family multidrug resistance protein
MVFFRKQNDLSCSVTNVLTAVLPMMATFLSNASMQFISRIYLAHYSIIAMNSIVIVQQICNTILLPLLCVVSLSEVFVGQFNGARQFTKTAVPPIQIAFCVYIFAFLLAPLPFLFRHKIIPETLYETAIPCLIISLCSAPLIIFHSSLSAFFIGTRRPKIILFSVFVGNVTNVILDFIFIFGIEGFLPPFGATGAVWGTIISQFISLLIMSCLFFSRKSNDIYCTRKLKFNISVLKKNIFMGIPYSFVIFVEMSTWVIVTNALAVVSLNEVTLNSICLSIWTFSLFMIEGLQKGVTALAANCLGAGKKDRIPMLFKSVVKVASCISIIFFFIFYSYSEGILDICFNIKDIKELPLCRETLFIQWIGFTVLSFSVGGIIGILNAGGDTRFVATWRICCFLISVITPVFIFKNTIGMRTIISWSLSAIYMSMMCYIYLRRYRSGRWNHNLIQEVNE